MRQIQFRPGLTALPQIPQLDLWGLLLSGRRGRKGVRGEWRGGGRHSLVYATPLLRHQARLGLSPALAALLYANSSWATPLPLVSARPHHAARLAALARSR